MSAEFGAKSTDATMATMTDRPFVNHVPVMTGGVGSDDVRHFYSTYFIPGHPPDIRVTPVARTIGETRIVDEMICSFTHTIEMPWLLPGVAPTREPCRVPGDRRCERRIQSSVKIGDVRLAPQRAACSAVQSRHLDVIVKDQASSSG